MARRLTIEWRRLDAGGRTCDRCAETGTALRRAVAALRLAPDLAGVEIVVRETILDAADLARSNQLLFDGRPLEDLLDQARAVETDCPSCAGLIGGAACCRAVDVRGTLFEAIPETLIAAAARRALSTLEKA